MTEINLEYSIINAYESVKGSDIKSWCENYKDNEEHEFSYDAYNLYGEYWENENVYKPNPNAYYFVEYFVSEKTGFPTWKLKRDKDNHSIKSDILSRI